MVVQDEVHVQLSLLQWHLTEKIKDLIPLFTDGSLKWSLTPIFAHIKKVRQVVVQPA